MKSKLLFTGERVIPEVNEGYSVYEEHLARYYFASNFVNKKTVLDIACGTGYGTKLLSEKAKKVFGVDISRDAIRYAKENYNARNVKYLEGTVAKIPLRDKTTDVVVSFETIEHVEEDEQKQFVAEVIRVLKDDGIFVCSTPNVDNSIKGNEFHHHELTKEEFKDLLSTHFSFVSVYYQELVSASYFVSEGKEFFEGEVSKTIEPVKSNFLVAVCSNKENSLNDYLYLSKLKPKELERRLKLELLSADKN